MKNSRGSRQVRRRNKEKEKSKSRATVMYRAVGSGVDLARVHRMYDERFLEGGLESLVGSEEMPAWAPKLANACASHGHILYGHISTTCTAAERISGEWMGLR